MIRTNLQWKQLIVSEILSNFASSALENTLQRILNHRNEISADDIEVLIHHIIYSIAWSLEEEEKRVKSLEYNKPLIELFVRSIEFFIPKTLLPLNKLCNFNCPFPTLALIANFCTYTKSPSDLRPNFNRAFTVTSATIGRNSRIFFLRSYNRQLQAN